MENRALGQSSYTWVLIGCAWRVCLQASNKSALVHEREDPKTPTLAAIQVNGLIEVDLNNVLTLIDDWIKGPLKLDVSMVQADGHMESVAESLPHVSPHFIDGCSLMGKTFVADSCSSLLLNAFLGAYSYQLS